MCKRYYNNSLQLTGLRSNKEIYLSKMTNKIGWNGIFQMVVGWIDRLNKR